MLMEVWVCAEVGRGGGRALLLSVRMAPPLEVWGERGDTHTHTPRTPLQTELQNTKH